MIYFLQRADGAIKIGTTEKYYTRHSALAAQFGNLKLLGVIEGGRQEEQQLHHQFSHVRVDTKRKSEWYQPSEELFEFIRKNTSPEIHTARDVTIKLSDKTYLLNFSRTSNSSGQAKR